MAESFGKGGGGGGGGGSEYYETEHETDDPEKLLELRELFNLYDVDASGFVDAKEIIAALKRNYTANQVRQTIPVTMTSLVLCIH